MNRSDAVLYLAPLLGGLLLAGHVGGHLPGQVHLKVGGEPRPGNGRVRSSTRVLLVPWSNGETDETTRSSAARPSGEVLR